MEAPAGSGRKQVLVIEDEQRIAAVIGRALAAAGFQVTVQRSGLDGLRLARSGDFDLLILDLLLPDIDGITILRRTMESVPEQRVLVLSALGDVHSKVQCLELGARDYLAKPFELAELIARVRVQLEQRNGANRYLRRGDLSLDLQRRIVTRGERQVPLAAREFLLLEHLMRKEGEVCARDELLAEVWGSTFDAGTNVVDVCIARVRSKLGAGCVETVRNVGYCFVGA